MKLITGSIFDDNKGEPDQFVKSSTQKNLRQEPAARVVDCDLVGNPIFGFISHKLQIGDKLYTTPPPPVKLQFPTMLRKMWSGEEVQTWIDEQLSNHTQESKNETLENLKVIEKVLLSLVGMGDVEKALVAIREVKNEINIQPTRQKPVAWFDNNGLIQGRVSAEQLIHLCQDGITQLEKCFPEQAPSKSTIFKFKRYVSGVRMAEDVVIEREKTLDAAIKKALTLCPNRDKTVLVYIPQQSD